MSLFRFEHQSKPVATPTAFAGRVGLNILAAGLIIAVALFAGMVGYRTTEGLDWLDCFLNAAMLLGGMGPVTAMTTAGGKLFAGVYALLCGLLLVLVTGIVLAPVLHRVLHALKVDDSGS